MLCISLQQNRDGFALGIDHAYQEWDEDKMGSLLLFGAGLVLFLDDAIRHGDFGKFDRIHHYHVGILLMLLGGSK